MGFFNSLKEEWQMQPFLIIYVWDSQGAQPLERGLGRRPGIPYPLLYCLGVVPVNCLNWRMK